ncbi:sugar phosphate isomerase/epimerase family protein [Paenibacillus chartarius]|uniref:Sugar phosphate isomerase/epimerase family protein n=1 Tax=Paenibacillus chartarius TaxID=747481 RepID=A0ABV6DIP7_9BACL
MKFGVSSYSLYPALRSKEMTIIDVIDYIADIGGEHVEIVPLGFNLTEQPELIEAIRRRAVEAGIELSNYAVGGNFADLDPDAFEQEIERLQREVDIAAALGVKLMRHDVASSPDISIRHYNEQLPRLAEACRRIADYAAEYGITTSVENHGLFVQAADRVQALIHLVDRDNFKTTLDVGNFLCVDEDPAAAVSRNIGYASMVHIKDFYVRRGERTLSEGWFRSAHGSFLRGAIVGHGDIDLPHVLRIIKQSGYDGCLSVEFEGIEPCRSGARIGLDQLKAMWNAV